MGLPIIFRAKDKGVKIGNINPPMMEGPKMHGDMEMNFAKKAMMMAGQEMADAMHLQMNEEDMMKFTHAMKTMIEACLEMKEHNPMMMGMDNENY